MFAASRPEITSCNRSSFTQHMTLALDEVGADVMADKDSRLLAALLVTDYRCNEIARNPHFRPA